MNIHDKKCNKGQALIEFILIITILMLIILGIMQFALIYSIKMFVNYAAYSSCRVGIVNYNNEGRFDVKKIRLAALMAMSPVAKLAPGISAGNPEDNPLTGNMSGLAGRIADTIFSLEVETPDENTLTNLRKICMREDSPELTVRLVYRYKPLIPIVCKIFKNDESLTGKGKGELSFITITGEATMPVEIGPPFTPDFISMF